MTMLRLRFASCLAAMLFAGAAAPTTARAQSDAPPVQAVESDRARALRSYQEGNRAFKETRWVDAEIAYLDAWTFVKSFEIAANLGLLALKLHKPREAAERLAFSLRATPMSADPAQLSRVHDLLDEAKGQIGTLRLRSSVPDVELWIDGTRAAAVDAMPQELFVDPGTHRVIGKRNGYADAAVTVEAPPGSSQDVTLRFVLLPPQATRMSSAPEAHAQPPARRSLTPLLVLGAASAVGLGIGMTVVSNGASDEAVAQRDAILSVDGHCAEPRATLAGSCTELRSTVSRVETFGNAARVAYAASGVLAIGAVAYALWPRAAPARASSVRVLPELRASGAGLTLMGAW